MPNSSKSFIKNAVPVVFLCAGAVFFALATNNRGYASNTYDPDTTVASVGYVDMKISEALSGKTADAPAPQTFTPVMLNKGDVLIGGEGTEIILRSGMANAYVFAENGLSDITAASELLNGDKITADHLLIVPRADKRGVVAQYNSTWFLIKGTYKITTF